MEIAVCFMEIAVLLKKVRTPYLSIRNMGNKVNVTARKVRNTGWVGGGQRISIYSFCSQTFRNKCQSRPGQGKTGQQRGRQKP
jgi:hypothetical protein